MTFYRRSLGIRGVERALMAGDPERVRQLSGLLEGPVAITEELGLPAYSGKYMGVPVVIATHGVGAPSFSVVFDDLAGLGLKLAVRLGTTGAIWDDIEVGDVILATGALYSPGGAMSSVSRVVNVSPAPDFGLTRRIGDELKGAGVNVRTGPVYSKNAFYSLEDAVKPLQGLGVLSLEMECAGFLSMAQAKGIRGACVLVVSDNVVKKTRMYTAKELREFVERAARATLGALVREQC